MKSEYGKNSYQGNKYQATANNADSNSRKPNAPTQGGFSTPGGGNLGGQHTQKDKTAQTPKNPNQQSNRNPNNTWGTGSINKTDKDSHR